MHRGGGKIRDDTGSVDGIRPCNTGGSLDLLCREWGKIKTEEGNDHLCV